MTRFSPQTRRLTGCIWMKCDSGWISLEGMTVTYDNMNQPRDSSDIDDLTKSKTLITQQPPTRKGRQRKKGGAERKSYDSYPTPVEFTGEIVRRIGEIIPYTPKLIIEPSAGDGAFVRAVKKEWPEIPILAVEIQDRAEKLYEAGASGVYQTDWVEWTRAVDRARTPAGPWLFIGNPPFVLAREHIEAAMWIMQPGEWIAFLLRINFFGAATRRDFWAKKRDRLRYLIPFCERPDFRGDGKSDPTEYGMFIFQKGWTGNAEILPNMSVATELVRSGQLAAQAAEEEAEREVRGPVGG
jgi:hypothetical protein